MNHIEKRIATGIDGLKSEAMPPAPATLVHQMTSTGTSAEGPVRNRALIVLTVGVLTVTGLMMLPQQSSAAFRISDLVEAHQKSDALYRITSYWINGGNRTPKMWHAYVQGVHWHYIQSDYEQASDGKRIMSYSPKIGKANTWVSTPSDSAGSILPRADLGWWKSDEAKGLTLEHNVIWNGRRVDKYVVVTHSKAWGATKNVLYADPILRRPIYGEFTHESGSGSALKWDYLIPADKGVLEIKMKPNTKIIDITLEKSKRQQSAPRHPEKAQRSQDGF
ncbi:MAG: hypothetical protein ABL949_09420 [Fimbriimonadaceae bacterium]